MEGYPAISERYWRGWEQVKGGVRQELGLGRGRGAGVLVGRSEGQAARTRSGFFDLLGTELADLYRVSFLRV